MKSGKIREIQDILGTSIEAFSLNHNSQYLITNSQTTLNSQLPIML
jgi:hypothetical protein